MLLLAYLFCLPKSLFDKPYSVVLEDRTGQLLGARIAKDGQWRFPELQNIPEKFEIALLEFEDRRFYQHWGVDPRGLGRAFVQNIRNRKIVSGGSTLSMQVIRLSRQPKSRSVFQKFIEIILATRMEFRFSKKEILQKYASHAPFGGNVVGLEAASWRYYAKPPDQLSWAEAATLAVLPNSPALIHPGRNRTALFNKRNRLLDRLVVAGKLDSLSAQLAKEESLPDKPHPLPRLAPHLLEYFVLQKNQSKNARFQTSLDAQVQERASKVLQNHQARLNDNQIHNAAALILDISSGTALAYVGNLPGKNEEHGNAIDMIQVPRSSGSILKPLLFALTINSGLISPTSLLPDIPTSIYGYKPENFNEKYEGMVPANRAVARSLNIPMVYLLQQYGLPKFHFDLQKMGISSLNPSADHYGLPLILGGAEVSLFEIAGIYASLARTINNFQIQDGQYNSFDWRSPSFLISESQPSQNLVDQPPIMSAGAAYHMVETMQRVERPNSEGEWQRFFSSQRIAWKTGTSFGFRDAWAIGMTPEHVVAVWCGNADMEGRPGLVGIKAAAPILFDLFDLFPYGGWFKAPMDELKAIPMCSSSGFRPLPHCPTDTILLPARSIEMRPCPYHQQINLNQSGTLRVDRSCVPQDDIQQKSWFILPPTAEYYYKLNHPEYAPLPPYHPNCQNDPDQSPMQIIYPKPKLKIYVPEELDGSRSKTVFQAVHRDPSIAVHWHLNQSYLGTTQQFHTLELDPPAGEHLLTLVDQNGYRIQRSFEVVVKAD